MSKSIKKGLAKDFDNYDEYQIAKYKKSNLQMSLVDVVNLVHPKPTTKNESALRDLINDTLKPANTWEVALSQGADKKATFERMISENSLGALATLHNLRNMVEADAPFMLPKNVNHHDLDPYNKRRNEPAFLSYVPQSIVYFKKIGISEVAEETTAVYLEFFRI